MTYPQPENGLPKPQPEQSITTPRTRERWHENAIIRTFFLPPALGAGLGVLFSLVLNLLDRYSEWDFGNLIHSLHSTFYNIEIGMHTGALIGLSISMIIRLCQQPRNDTDRALKRACKGLVKGAIVVIPILAVGLLGGMAGIAATRKR